MKTKKDTPDEGTIMKKLRIYPIVLVVALSGVFPAQLQ